MLIISSCDIFALFKALLSLQFIDVSDLPTGFPVRFWQNLTASTGRRFLVFFIRTSDKEKHSPGCLSGCVTVPVADLNVSVCLSV
jgi:hypothetical protein